MPVDDLLSSLKFMIFVEIIVVMYTVNTTAAIALVDELDGLAVWRSG